MIPAKPIRVAVTSLGCPKALVDSEKMLGLLAEAGCLVGAAADEADVILINTCAFIAPAREESMQAIDDAIAAKLAGKVRRVVVAGCLPQKQSKELLEARPEIDAVIGVFNRDDVVKAILGDAAGFARIIKPPKGNCDDDRGRMRLTPRHTAYLRLSEGCSAGCSYCTIPRIRGPLRSKAMAQIVAEAKELAADGAIELNLIAQDTTAYGNDLSGGADLPRLLRKLNRVDGLRWIRIMYANPATMTPAAVEAMAECDKVVPYLDIPLQHVADGVLRRMRRRYTGADVEALLAHLRALMPDIVLRTTFIVGFPGETAAEFAQLAKFVEAARFDAMGAFPYYPEPGTPAAALSDQVRPATRTRRRNALMARQQAIAFALAAGKVGRELDVIVDGPDSSGRCLGRHAGQAPEIDGVCIFAKPVPAGSIVRAKVVAAEGYDLVVRRS